MGTSVHPVLLVIASETLDRAIAATCTEQRELRPLFASDLLDAVDVLVATEVAAIAVVPPLRDIDSFALSEALRRQHPMTPIAIVLGGSRHDEHSARVLWNARDEVPPAARAAVNAMGAEELGDWAELAWDGTTAEVAMERLAAASSAA
jgi:hypothetical protein